MADGTERPISEIRRGDRVIGRSGGVNRVIGLHIVPLGPRSLFGINRHAPFFTAEHPFLTPGGWRALDHAATRVETPGLRVAELTAGDVLITAAAVSGETAGALALAPAVSFSQLVLHRLSRAEGSPGDLVFNLILDGDHSYVASGFVVHNKGGEGGGNGGNGGGEGGNGRGGENDQGDDNDRSDPPGADPQSGSTSTDGGAAESSESSGGTGGNSQGGENEQGAPIPTTPLTSEFTGSAAPASPDLTASEEEELILNGWQ